MNINSTSSSSGASYNPYNAYKNVTRIGGLASGLDTDTIIQGLMSMEKVKVNKLYQQQQLIKWQQEDYLSIYSDLSDFKNYIFDMKLTSNFAKISASGDAITNGTVSVSASATALEGTYQVKVNSLAETAKVMLNSVSSKYVANGNYQFSVGGQDFSITLDSSITSSNFGSYIASQINANQTLTNAGISAYYDSTLDRMIISTKTTGSNTSLAIKGIDNIGSIYNLNSLTLIGLDSKFVANTNYNFSFNGSTYTINSGNSVDDFGNAIIGVINGISGFNATYDSINKKITINGNIQSFDFTNVATSQNVNGKDLSITVKDPYNIENNLTSATNSISLFGTTITAKNTNSSYQSFTVSKDIDSIVNKVKEFVSKYNDLISKLNSKVTEKRNRDYQPLTEDQKAQMTQDQITKWEEVAKKGLLNGDSIINGFLSNARKNIYENVSGLSSDLSQLSQVGITTLSYQENGKLYVDETKLRNAIANDFSNFVKIFTNGTTSTSYEQKGILNRLYDTVNNTLNSLAQKAGKPTTYSIYDTSELGKSLKNINKMISDEEDRLQRVQDRYYKQFATLEDMISKMNNQSSWLSQQFSK
ncbi:flagellar filament capping protein FliD [Caldicellulosiruptoraceae bacterium PP1]